MTMRAVAFAIPGNPFGKQRPRAGRGGRIYTPTETARHENTIGCLALPHFPAPIQGPVRLTVEAVFAVPPSWSKRKRAAMLGQPHTSKPDASNVAKAVEDGLNRIAYADDAQIAEVVTRKRWGETAETRVTVEALGDLAAPGEWPWHPPHSESVSREEARARVQEGPPL